MSVTDLSRRHQTLTLLLATAALPLLALTLFSPFYQTNDDVAMRLLSEGKFAPGAGPTPFLMHVNIVLGEVVSLANRLLPRLPWYDLVLGASMTAAAAALMAVWLGSGTRIEKIWTVVFALFFLLPAFVSVQFSLVGLGCAAAGIALVAIAAVEPLERQTRHLHLVLGAGLFTWGALVRFEGAVLMAIEGTLLALPLVIGAWRDAEARLRLRGVAAAAGAALALAILSFALNQYVYARARGWEEFHEYNFHRSRLSEYITSERLTPKTLDRLATEVGWDNIDFALFRNWFFTDPNLYSLAKVRQAERVFYEAPVAPKEESRAARLKRGIDLGKALFVEMRMALLVLGGFVLARGFGARLLLYFAGVLLTLAVLLAGITLTLKAPPPRVFWPMLLLAATMLTIGARRWRRPVHLSVSLGAALAVLCVAASALLTLHQESLGRRSGAELVRWDVERVRPTGATFFVLHGDAFPYEDYWRPLRVEKTPFPFIGLGVSARTPPVQDSLRRTGRTDLPLSLCSEPGLVLVARESLPPLLVPFLARHHGLTVRFEPYFRGQRFTAWRCVR
jgi:hypothetical protein